MKFLQSRARAFGDKECNRLNEKWNQFLNLDLDGMVLPTTSIKVHHQIWVGVRHPPIRSRSTCTSSCIYFDLPGRLNKLRSTFSSVRCTTTCCGRDRVWSKRWKQLPTSRPTRTVLEKLRKMLTLIVAIQLIPSPRSKAIIQTSTRLSVCCLDKRMIDQVPGLI